MNKEVRNILLFGRTGSGKSTVANVLTNSKKFNEGEFGVSETKDVQIETFNEIDPESGEKITYRIIDTVGIGDTGMSEQDVLFKTALVAAMVKEHGINRVLFLANGRFDESVVKAYDLLSKVIFDEEIFKNTTIVRSNFASFADNERCKGDIKFLKERDQIASPIINKIDSESGDIVHINNPSLGGEREEVEGARKNRSKSRQKLSTHLFQRPTIYRSENLNEIGGRILEHLNKEKKEKETLEKELKKLQGQLTQMGNDAKTEKGNLANQLAELEQKLKDLKEKTKAEVAGAMVGHIEKKKVTIPEMMDASVKMVGTGAVVGAVIGSVVPVAGTIVGGLVGTGLGTFGALTGAAIYFVNTLLGN